MVCERVQWKALPKEIKDRYEERARLIAMDSATNKISDTTISLSDAALFASDSHSMSPHTSAHLMASGILPALLYTHFIFYLLWLPSSVLCWFL